MTCAPFKPLHLFNFLVLLGVSAATGLAQDRETIGEREDILGQGAIAEPAVTSRHLAQAPGRLADAEAMDDLDAAIAEIETVIADLVAERRAWEAERERISNDIRAVERERREVNKEIDDIEDAILASSIASAGFVSPELVAMRDRLYARRDRIRHHHQTLLDQLQEVDRKIAQIDELVRQARERLAAKQAEKRGLEQRIAAVSIVAPSPGARLLVDAEGALRIRSDRPPERIYVEVQEKLVSGGTGPNDPLRETWRPVYNQTLRWEDLDSAGPGLVELPFRTGVRTDRNYMPIVGLERFWLDRGEYRAHVRDPAAVQENEPARPGAGNAKDRAGGGFQESQQPEADDQQPEADEMRAAPIAWRSFSVVGRLDNEAVRRPAADPSDQPQIDYRPKRIESGAAMRPPAANADQEEEKED